MKITKENLQRIITEETLKLIREYEDAEDAEYAVGDYVEISISADGYDRSIERLDSPDQFESLKGMYQAVKILAQVVQVAETDPDA